MTALQTPPDVVVFDLGNVLIRWDPRNLYRKLFGNETAAMERFLAEVCNTAWNEQLDKGRPWKEAISEAVARRPSQEKLIRAYHERWEEMLDGAIEETVQILEELRSAGVRLLALTNWSAETFSIARKRFAFLQWFEGILVSGEEGMIKPDPEIFKLLIQRYELSPSRTIFIDDNSHNIRAAEQLGFHALHFMDAGRLRHELAEIGLPVKEMK